MSIRHVTAYIVDCNGGCANTFGDLYHDEIDAVEAVNNSDWRSDGEDHWCPDCQQLPHDCAPDPEDPSSCARCGDWLGEPDPETQQVQP